MSSTASPLTEQARLLYHANRYEQAMELLARQVASAPDDPEALLLLARCQQFSKRHQEALRTAEAVISLTPERSDAHYVRACALRSSGDLAAAEAGMRDALRVNPDHWPAHADRGEMLINLGRVEEALQEGLEAVRIAPDETKAWHALWKTAAFNRRQDLCDEARRQMLRIDPADGFGVLLTAEKTAAAPGTSAAQAATTYADALSVVPDQPGLRSHLDGAVYRMLRGTRWLALLCLLMAAVTADVFPTGGEAKELPVPWGTRLWALCLMAAVWGFGAWRRYRKMRTGARLTVRSLVRREFWARVVLGQAAWATLCALLIVVVPWTERGVPQWLFWLGLVPNLLSITHDRNKVL
ncbi:tetratricopeptide repeat protein [Streptomyces purpureus]|uniref:tetratricopeptide repeat protein n=1 Tax=Streptomyces purpureus TaxID=1951 RepID=UPI00379C3C3A